MRFSLKTPANRCAIGYRDNCKMIGSKALILCYVISYDPNNVQLKVISTISKSFIALLN